MTISGLMPYDEVRDITGGTAAFHFFVDRPEDLLVTHVAAGGSSVSILYYGRDFDVFFNSEDHSDGGYIKFYSWSPYTDGTLTIRRHAKIDNVFDYERGGEFFLPLIGGILDRLVRIGLTLYEGARSSTGQANWRGEYTPDRQWRAGEYFKESTSGGDGHPDIYYVTEDHIGGTFASNLAAGYFAKVYDGESSGTGFGVPAPTSSEPKQLRVNAAGDGLELEHVVPIPGLTNKHHIPFLNDNADTVYSDYDVTNDTYRRPLFYKSGDLDLRVDGKFIIVDEDRGVLEYDYNSELFQVSTPPAASSWYGLFLLPAVLGPYGEMSIEKISYFTSMEFNAAKGFWEGVDSSSLRWRLIFPLRIDASSVIKDFVADQVTDFVAWDETATLATGSSLTTSWQTVSSSFYDGRFIQKIASTFLLSNPGAGPVRLNTRQYGSSSSSGFVACVVNSSTNKDYSSDHVEDLLISVYSTNQCARDFKTNNLTADLTWTSAGFYLPRGC